MGAKRVSYIYIPASGRVAERQMRAGLARGIERLGKREFLKVYCSVAYLFPGFHPDGIEDWDGPDEVVQIGREAWRRAGMGELTEDELYPSQATRAGLIRGRRGAEVGE